MIFRKCTECNERTEYLFRCEGCRRLFCPSDICSGMNIRDDYCAFACIPCRINQIGKTVRHWKNFTLENILVHLEVFAGKNLDE